MESLVDMCWLPSGAISDPIRWVRKEQNVVADYLWNCSMDNRQTWQHMLATDIRKDVNLIFHCDGGARQTCGAAAWIVHAAYWDEGCWKSKVVAFSATYFAGVVSSFTAEALALCSCSFFAKDFIQNHLS